MSSLAVSSPIQVAPPGSASPGPTSDEEAESGGNVKRLERYSGSAIPLLGGFIQARYGFDELRSGSRLEANNGRIDIALGSATSIGQISQSPIYLNLMLHMNHQLLAIAGPLAGIAGVVSSIVDGGRDIYNGCHLHKKEAVAIGAVKVGSGLISATGAGATILLGADTANLPMMMVGTAIYTGATLYQNREALAKVYHSARSYVVEKMSQGLELLGG